VTQRCSRCSFIKDQGILFSCGRNVRKEVRVSSLYEVNFSDVTENGFYGLSTLIYIDNNVLINKHLHYFSTFYIEKNTGGDKCYILFNGKLSTLVVFAL
jgi:hypothetical protein